MKLKVREMLPQRGSRNHMLKLKLLELLPQRGSGNHMMKLRLLELLPQRGSRNHMMKLKVLKRENVMKYVKRISLAKLHVLMAAKNADPFSGLQDQGAVFTSN